MIWGGIRKVVHIPQVLRFFFILQRVCQRLQDVCARYARPLGRYTKPMLCTCTRTVILCSEHNSRAWSIKSARVTESFGVYKKYFFSVFGW